jgi:hypothetical protein
MTETCVYHRKSEAFMGDKIYPLNSLPFQDIKEKASRKYAGRGALLESRVPPLDCLWNDVIHCTPVHPQKVVNALKAAGFETPRMEFFVIPVELLDPKTTTIFLSSTDPNADRYAAENYLELTTDRLSTMQELPEATIRYYRESKQQNRNPLMYVGVPHVLYKGVIAVGELATMVVASHEMLDSK